MSRTHASRAIAVVAIVAAAALAGGCAASSSTPDTPTDPGGGGVVSAPAEADALTLDGVTFDSACALVSESATLTDLGAVGTPVDTSFITDLSRCEITLAVAEGVDASFGVGILTAEDVALTAGSDTTVAGGALVPLPGLGENGHFLSRVPGADPADDPRSGAILASRGDLGISLAWATAQDVAPYATYEQAVREMLGALSE